MRSGKPLVQRDVAAFVQRADRDGERFAASVALVQAGAGCLALHQGRLIDGAAMRANRAARPQFSLKPFAGFLGVVKFGAGEVTHRIGYVSGADYIISRLLCQGDNSGKSPNLMANESSRRWFIYAAFGGKVAIVRSLQSKVFADAAALEIRAEYPDPRADFWVAKAHYTQTASWGSIRPQLSRDGVSDKRVFGAERTRQQAGKAMENLVYLALRRHLRGERRDMMFDTLPYRVDELMAYIAGQFRPGMSWENWGEWEIDHIKPRRLFDMRIPAQTLECWALSNLQPLWASENSAKATQDKEAA